MSDQYIGEIRAFGFNYATYGWAQCNGQSMSISQNTALYTIIGTTYGGDGVQTFNLPNLQSLTAVGMGQGTGLRNWPIGGVFGEANHTLLIGEVPTHQHTVTGGGGVSFAAETRAPDATAYLGRWDGRAYSSSANTTLSGQTVSPAGGSQPHPNVQPVSVLNFCIALQGVFPPRS
jgi:microcystin-dependent protein